MSEKDQSISKPSPEEGEEHKTYHGRYYVLVVFSLMCAQQNLAWITFSPIGSEAKEWYGLTDIELTLLPGERNYSYNIYYCQYLLICV